MWEIGEFHFLVIYGDFSRISTGISEIFLGILEKFVHCLKKIKRAGTRNRRKKLRPTTPILMKIGSLVDFDLKITYQGLFLPFGPVLGVILGSEGQKWGKSGNLCRHF